MPHIAQVTDHGLMNRGTQRVKDRALIWTLVVLLAMACGPSSAVWAAPSGQDAVETSKEAEAVKSSKYKKCFGPGAPLDSESFDCLDAEYHRLDAILIKEYPATLARLPNDAEKQRLEQSERNWRRTRFRHCKDEVGDVRGSTGAVVNEDCEIDALAQHIVWLRHYGR